MNERYDVAVIGSGAGGGMMAAELARTGYRVLLLERGGLPHRPLGPESESTALGEMNAFEGRSIEIDGDVARHYIGGLIGGGTSLYGAVLMRPSPEDFTPGRFYFDWIDRSEWTWPIDYDDLAPHYDRVERMMGVRADRPERMPFIGVLPNGHRATETPLAPIAQRLSDAIDACGHTSMRLPLAIDPERCLDCAGCPGYRCPTGARRSTADIVRDAVARGGTVTIETGREVERILFGTDGTARGLRVRNVVDGSVDEVVADRYVLAAGAIGSPVILMRSGYRDQSGMVGRNYSFHAGALAVGLFRRPTGGADRFIKQVGFSDLYFGSDRFRHKLGIAQMLPTPGPMMTADSLPFPTPKPLASAIARRTLLLSGIVEDLPHPENRVELGRDGRIRLHHRFHPYDRERSDFFAAELKRVMKRSGADLVLTATAEKSKRHTAHQVGTLRFGTDPTRSVLTPECRLHESENVWVVDGSFMPTSLGVGPALTIMANALRVAAKEFGATRRSGKWQVQSGK